MAAELKIFQPSKYYSLFIKEGVRPDGRQLSEYGPTSVSVGCISTADGSSLVHLGDTVVMCGIKAELANPSQEEPKKGYIVPNVDFPPVCSKRFMPGPPSEEAQVYSQLIFNLLKETAFIDSYDLCIDEGKLCWCLYIDITCLNYAGSVLDACVLAMVAAVSNVSLPEVKTEDSIEVMETKHPLKVQEPPFCSTFAVFEGGLVSDPTVEEETVGQGTVSIFMKANGQICNMYMAKGCIMSEDSLKSCIRQSKSRCKSLLSLVKNVNSQNAN